MYDVENEFVTRFWGPIDKDSEWNEDDFSKIMAKLENSTEIFISLYWEHEGKQYGIDIPYERFNLAAKEAGIDLVKEFSSFTHEERSE